MLISEKHREINRQLHGSRADYGAGGHKHRDIVQGIASSNGCLTVLDYGCGKGTLKEHLRGVEVHEYDPAIFGKDDPPEPADMVYCGDVLEHVEPECLEDVLDDLERVTAKLALFNIATHLANKVFPDGRNTHLIVQQPEWWMEKIRKRFRIAEFHGTEGDVYFILIARTFAQRLEDEAKAALAAKTGNGSGAL